MDIIYSDQPIVELLDLARPSVFLVGPTPRSSKVESWRPSAISHLKSLGYNGQVLVPERIVKAKHINYDDQVEWEDYGLENCTVIACWVPRDLETMPAFTTNVEFGRFVASKRMLYGRPEHAPKNRYLDWLYKKHNKTTPIYSELFPLMEAASKL